MRALAVFSGRLISKLPASLVTVSASGLPISSPEKTRIFARRIGMINALPVNTSTTVIEIAKTAVSLPSDTR